MNGCPHPHHRDLGMPTVAQVRWAEANEAYCHTIHRGHNLLLAGNVRAGLACLDDAAEQEAEAA